MKPTPCEKCEDSMLHNKDGKWWVDCSGWRSGKGCRVAGPMRPTEKQAVEAWNNGERE